MFQPTRIQQTGKHISQQQMSNNRVSIAKQYMGEHAWEQYKISVAEQLMCFLWVVRAEW
jgi:hypothetical protein